jgi:hypothetical protein
MATEVASKADIAAIRETSDKQNKKIKNLSGKID